MRLQESPLFKENTVIFFMDPARSQSNAKTVFLYLLISPGWRLVEKESINLILPFSSAHLHPLCSHTDLQGDVQEAEFVLWIFTLFSRSAFFTSITEVINIISSVARVFTPKLKKRGECGSWLSVSETYWSAKSLVIYITTCTYLSEKALGIAKSRGPSVPSSRCGDPSTLHDLPGLWLFPSWKMKQVGSDCRVLGRSMFHESVAEVGEQVRKRMLFWLEVPPAGMLVWGWVPEEARFGIMEGLRGWGPSTVWGGVLAWKKYLWETYSEENGLSETQAVNSVLRSVNWAPGWCAVVWDLLLESWNSRLLRRGPCGVGPGYSGGELHSAGAWGWVAMWWGSGCQHPVITDC